jgi:radical SAM superfamily enzyme YgiQ (UPF0313 family)
MDSKPVSFSRCRVLLVYPQFVAPSFWNFKTMCELAGASYPMAPLGLITVAAMLPASWELRLIDRNVTRLTASDIDWADLIMTTGMLPQQLDTLEVIRLCQERGKPVAVGGPDVTSSPEVYKQADIRVLGEAELVIDHFIDAWDSGERRGVFEAEKFKADVTRTPIPRFDLLDFKNYLFLGVQYSRGCPFTCEFCDIIELYGRVPRTKTNRQMLAEIETIYNLGYRGHLDFVDDNFVGNKKAVKKFLPELAIWQRDHGYPFEFSTEASINLADDDRLLQMMRDANFIMIFVGIESPNSETLVSTQKKQNTRRNLAASIHKIYGAGIFVNAGFILGFDNETGSVAEEMIACIDETSIPISMVGLLYALPNTQLTRRLEREGRLYVGHGIMPKSTKPMDQCTMGLNFETARPRRDILMDYVRVLERIYQPDSFFSRVRHVGRHLRLPPSDGFLGLARGDLVLLFGLIWYLLRKQPHLIRHFWSAAYDCFIHNPSAIKSVLILTAFYLHVGPFASTVIETLKTQIALLNEGSWIRPDLVRVPSVQLAGVLMPASAAN